ncbi:MAG: hypothetical protein KJ634_02115 [Gammaproteobacteria bacterium]|nr:hypothetical protein [Gammaproteobacteria bacterium]MBU1414394.1 hypothetical protein [Gammaproteobacteria bacterium]
MHRRLFHLLPLFVAALWLPFQAIAATAMPFCRHGEAHKMALPVADVAAEHCAMHDPQPEPVDHGLGCDDCGVCHLLAAGFIPTAEQATAILPLAQDYRADVPLAPASATPEPPQQPPKRLA